MHLLLAALNLRNINNQDDIPIGVMPSIPVIFLAILRAADDVLGEYTSCHLNRFPARSGIGRVQLGIVGFVALTEPGIRFLGSNVPSIGRPGTLRLGDVSASKLFQFHVGA